MLNLEKPLQEISWTRWHLELELESCGLSLLANGAGARLLPEVLAGFTPCQLIEGCWIIRKQKDFNDPRKSVNS